MTELDWRTCPACADYHVVILPLGPGFACRCKACGREWPLRCKQCGRTDRLSSEEVHTRKGPRPRVRCQCGVTDASWCIHTPASGRRTNAAWSFRQRHSACYRCGLELGARGGEVHHVIPLSQGGPDTWDNMVLLCVPCHQAQHPDLLHLWSRR